MYEIHKNAGLVLRFFKIPFFRTKRNLCEVFSVRNSSNRALRITNMNFLRIT